MGSNVETTQSAAPALLALSAQSTLVQITLCSVGTSCDGMTPAPRVQPVEPVAGNPHGGFCEGDRHKRPQPQVLSLPTIRFLTNCFYVRCESIPTVLGCCSILNGGSKLLFSWKMAPLNLEKEELPKVQQFH